MSKKFFMRPRSLSMSSKPASSRQPIYKPPVSLPPLRDSSHGSIPAMNTTPPTNPFSNSLRTKLTKAKSSTNSTKQAQLLNANPDTIPTVSYTIKLLSNWGRSDLIACSEIIPIDSSNHHVPVIQISAMPKGVSETDLSKLVKGFESHEDSSDIWSSPYPQQSPIEITMDVPCEKPLKMIRFFNANETYKDAGIRRAEIWSDEIKLWEGEIPYDFPYVAHLKRPTTNIQHSLQTFLGETPNAQNNKPHDVNPMNCYVDPFGIIPQIPTKTITLEFISSYSNSSTFGLSGIEILTTKKEILDSSQISEIKIHHLSSAGNPTTLFRGHYSDPKIDDMWLFDRVDKDKNPSLTISFEEPILVGQLRIWNFFPSCPTSSSADNSSAANKAKQKICTKNILIKFDGNNLVYAGRINQGDGTLKRLESGMTIIFVNEMDYKFQKSTKYINNPPVVTHSFDRHPQFNPVQIHPISSTPIPRF